MSCSASGQARDPAPALQNPGGCRGNSTKSSRPSFSAPSWDLESSSGSSSALAKEFSLAEAAGPLLQDLNPRSLPAELDDEWQLSSAAPGFPPPEGCTTDRAEPAGSAPACSVFRAFQSAFAREGASAGFCPDAIQRKEKLQAQAKE